MRQMHTAKFGIGQIVKHRLFEFRGVVFDVDPEFNNTDEWYNSIPEEARPRKNQPFYHLLAENEETEYVAYVSEQNLLVDDTSSPVRHPQVKDYFSGYDQKKGRYNILGRRAH
jgi:heat shock protein HspQ